MSGPGISPLPEVLMEEGLEAGTNWVGMQLMDQHYHRVASFRLLVLYPSPSLLSCTLISHSPVSKAPRPPIRRIGRSLHRCGEGTGRWDGSREYIDGPAFRTGLGPSLYSRPAKPGAHNHLRTRPPRSSIPCASQTAPKLPLRMIGRSSNQCEGGLEAGIYWLGKQVPTRGSPLRSWVLSTESRCR